MTNWITNPTKKRQAILVAGDIGAFFVFVLATAAAYSANSAGAFLGFLGALGGGWFFGLLVLQLLVLYVSNLYSVDDTRERGGLYYGGRLLVAESAALGIAAVVWLFTGGEEQTRQLLFWQVPAMTVAGTLWRVTFFSLQERSVRHLAITGKDQTTEAALEWLQDLPVQAYRVLGSIQGVSGDRLELVTNFDEEIPEEASAALPSSATTTHHNVGGPDTDTARNGEATVATKGVSVPLRSVDTIVCAVDGNQDSSLLQQAVWLRQRGVEVYDLPSFAARHYGRIPVSAINSSWVLQETQTEWTEGISGRISRVVDVIVALLGLVLAAPLMGLIALAVKLDSTGPVLFAQERLGLNREPFTVYKFRTMVQNAEEKTGPRWADEQDPRVTRVGNFLRKTRLDELPQLVNVLHGDMSLVGFRPIRKHFADLLEEKIPFYRLRFSIKPGLTGWPQVRHDYSGSIEGQKKKFEYELFYLANQSPLLDLYIAVKTLQVVLFGHGQ